MDTRAAYERVRQRVEGLVSDEVADTQVPACPGWSVKDVVAHNAGFIEVYKREGAQGFGPGWGDAVVEARRERSLQENLQEWRDLTKDPGDMFESNLGLVAVADVLAHEQDIRAAVGEPGEDDDEAIVPAVQLALSFAAQKVQKEGLPPVKVVTPDLEQTVGEGEPVATLRSSTFELFRTVHGRRTEEQLRAMEWDGDPGDSAPALFIFGPTRQPVE